MFGVISSVILTDQVHAAPPFYDQDNENYAGGTLDNFDAPEFAGLNKMDIFNNILDRRQAVSSEC